MTKQNQAPSPKPTELQELVEKFRVANFHLSNLLRLAEENARDEMETIIAAAHHYVNVEHEVYERLDAIADAEAQKGGAA
jgi:hypothetical protein